MVVASLACASQESIVVTRAEYDQLVQLVKQQSQQIDDAKSRITWTWNELQKAQQQAAQVAKERDDYRQFGDAMQQRWTDAEQRVAKAQKRIVTDDLIFAAIGVAIIGFIALKIGITRFIP